ncbi:hypothetical protein [Bradyrhizobium yuanmingense]|uniref:hypothetical protein n=1 Tax=Bradyrhizobium yuanmingense TaxID=108015 RepID=UPI0023B9E0BD|nr:hypothetical protein [Bradyrhizobium yuanmingense]MDF0584730.1 hypothetical protein [Bradyrhizobium yuanmingense]
MEWVALYIITGIFFALHFVENASRDGNDDLAFEILGAVTCVAAWPILLVWVFIEWRRS